ncbi:MAG: hypothetical protein WC934_12590 [Acidithiobacillus sp.]|jgi:hypothetical protein|uniref:hypothetical protein n=1 Tax=Acidithiobacillus sp. TaxID=1872118 RepID=UPI003560911A
MIKNSELIISNVIRIAYLRPPRWIPENKVDIWDTVIKKLREKSGKDPSYPVAINYYKNKVLKTDTGLSSKERREQNILDPEKNTYIKEKGTSRSPKEYGDAHKILRQFIKDMDEVKQPASKTTRVLIEKFETELRKNKLRNYNGFDRIFEHIKDYKAAFNRAVKFRGKDTPSASRKKIELKGEITEKFRLINRDMALLGI